MKAPVPSLEGRLCVITGAASGIGRATAQAAARRGARLALTDVQAEALDAVAAELGPAVVAHRAFDVSDVDAVRAFADAVHAAAGSADVVMNVAGIATWGPVDRLTHEQWRRTVDIDLMGPIHVIEAFVPPMIAARRGGQLVNVSSAAGLVGLPWHAPYSAAKYGLRGVSEVLRFDLRRHRIGVTLVCPGGVDTAIVDSVDIAGVPKGAMEAAGLTKRFRRHAKSSEQVAEIMLDGVTRNRYLVHTAVDIRALHLLERCVPPLYRLIMRVANDQFVKRLESAARAHA
jgi:NAD(P)-dependent dehydrogenase (short-subunit alcohol dehydrogenase family)